MSLRIDNLIDSFEFEPAKRDHNTINSKCLKIQIGFDLLSKSYIGFLKEIREGSVHYSHYNRTYEGCVFESKKENVFLLLHPKYRIATVFIYKNKSPIVTDDSCYVFNNNFIIKKELFNECIKDSLSFLVSKTKSKNLEMYFLDDNEFPLELLSQELKDLFDLKSLKIHHKLG